MVDLRTLILFIIIIVLFLFLRDSSLMWSESLLCPISALSQPQLLRGQRAQAPNPVGFPGTWPLLAPPMVPPDIMQPGSVPLPGAPPVPPLLPVRAPGFSPMSSQPPAPPVSFPGAHPPGGPGTPHAGVLPTTGILTPHPGQSSPMASLSSPPHYHLGSLFPQASELGLGMSTESVAGLQRLYVEDSN